MGGLKINQLGWGHIDELVKIGGLGDFQLGPAQPGLWSFLYVCFVFLISPSCIALIRVSAKLRQF